MALKRSMGTIRLTGLEFYAYHGLYEAEHAIGNRYTVDVALELDLQTAGLQDDVRESLDYSGVYQLVAEQMQVRRKILEAVSLHIAEAILTRYPNLEAAEVSVAKHTPPFGGLCQSASVSQRLTRSDWAALPTRPVGKRAVSAPKS